MYKSVSRDLDLIDNVYTFPVSTQMKNEMKQRSQISKNGKDRKKSSWIGEGAVVATIMKDACSHVEKLYDQCMGEIEPLEGMIMADDDRDEWLENFRAVFRDNLTLEKKHEKTNEAVEAVKKRKKCQTQVEKEIRQYEKRQKLGDQENDASLINCDPLVKIYYKACRDNVTFGMIGLVPNCWLKKNTFPRTFEDFIKTNEGNLLANFCRIIKTIDVE